MSFRKHSNPLLLSGAHPGGTLGEPLWSGIANTEDSGYHLYKFNDIWTIAQYLGNWYEESGTALYPVHKSINGYIYFVNGTALFLFYDAVYGWVLSSSLLPCNEYWAYSDPDDTELGGHYYGNNFWNAASLPSSGASVTFKARGYQRGDTLNSYKGTDKTVEFAFDRWEAASSQFGEYEAKGESSGSKYFGLPQWTDGDGNTYTRSVSKTDGKYTYGSIWYDATNSKWLIGTYGSVSGWWEGSEPSKTGSVTFNFTVPEGSELTGENKVISFDQYIEGSETMALYIANAGVFTP